VLGLAAYAAQSSNRLNYACRQVGTTFVLVFAGLSRAADIYGPLWRILGNRARDDHRHAGVHHAVAGVFDQCAAAALAENAKLDSDLLRAPPHASSEEFVQSTSAS